MNTGTNLGFWIGLLASVSLLSATANAQTGDQRQTETAPESQEASSEESAPIGSYRISFRGVGSELQPPSQRLQEILRRPHHELYQGVIPGLRDDLPGFTAPPEPDRNAVTWIGVTPGEYQTRVFVQTERPVQHRVRPGEEPGTTVVVLEDARITKSNFSRFIDTSHFGGALQRIEARQADSDTVEMLVQTDAGVEPAISGEGRYLHVDVPRDTEEGGRQMAAAERGQIPGDSAPAGPQGEPTDETAPAPGAAGAPDEQLPPDADPAGPQQERTEETAPAQADDPDAADAPDEQLPPSERQLTDRTADDDDRGPDSPSTQHRLALLSGVSGVALLAGGGAMTWMASSYRSVVTDVPRHELVPTTQRRGADIEQTANRMDTAGLIMALTGGAALVTGGLLWMTSPSADESSSHSLRFRANPGEGAVGFDWTLLF